MSERRTPEELWELLERNVSSWPHERLQQHGFDLLFGDPERLANDRRAHARKVLVAQHALADQVEHHQTPVIVMKGLEVAMLYPRPIERPFRDIDILVRDPRPRWDRLVEQGHRKSPKRAIDIDHHHLPALEHPTGVLGIELHHSPNLPGWAKIPNDLIFETAQPSRTGIEGTLRPRDDIHALLLALHCWKGGFTRLRDLFDALLLDSMIGNCTSATAGSMGLDRFWDRTVVLASETHLAMRSTDTPSWTTRAIVGHGANHRRMRSVVAPFYVVGPIRATGAIISSARRRQANRKSPVN